MSNLIYMSICVCVCVSVMSSGRPLAFKTFLPDGSDRRHSPLQRESEMKTMRFGTAEGHELAKCSSRN